METVRMTVGQAIVQFLDAQWVSLDGEETKFVDGVATIFGHGIVCGLGQALDENPRGLRVYQGRNEQGMAHMAAGFAKQANRRRIIACAASVGPGSANMVTAVADATANNVPLLVLTGDTFATRQPDPVLQQIEQFHDASLSTNDAFRPVSRYWDRVTRPEQLMTALLNAMRVLTDPERTGGVCIALPQDVQGESFDWPVSFLARRVHRIARLPAEADVVAEAARRIAGKHQPLVIIGGGVRYSEAGEAVRRFCEQYGVPFAETQSGKSVLPSSHPLNLGGIGVTGNLAANRLAEAADMVIGVGTRLTDFTTGSKELFRNPAVEFVLVNVSRHHAEKLDATPVVADARAGVEALRASLAGTGWHAAARWMQSAELARADWAVEMKRLTGLVYADGYASPVAKKEPGVEEEFVRATGGVLTQTAAIGLVRAHIEADAIVVGASGSLPGDLQRMWTTEARDAYHMEYGYSCMGYEIAAALGAKLAFPERACYAMVGDGAFMMLHSEIATAIQERKKITVLLFDNCGFGCINNLQMGKGMGSLATMFRYREAASGQQDGALIATDFAMIGRGYGMTTWTARTGEELSTALEMAKRETGCVLIDIKVLPKSMTDGYGAWWHVGIGDSDRNAGIHAAYEDKVTHLVKARRY